MPSRRRATASRLLHLRVALLHPAQDFALLQRLVQRHVERRRDLLGDLVHVGERHLEHAADIADHRLGLHRPEGDDLRDLLAAVLLGDVVDDLAAAAYSQKSMSMSGSEMRSGFRKRSKMRS